MKILLTGASSFTGMWFATALVDAGHEVTATFRAAAAAGYADETRRLRVESVASRCRPVFDCSFGDGRFVDLIDHEGPFDALCQHGAEVTNYRSPAFDVGAALCNNSMNLNAVLEALGKTGCGRVVLTGSVFEGGEGAGSEGLPHFSAYGLSKALTAEVWRYQACAAGFRFGKFVIPNPFGPLEEARFTAYLVRSWFAGEAPVVQTPAYVRDNIHVSLLAKAYARFVASLPAERGTSRLGPTGYVESQGAFSRRFAAEMTGRLGIPCPVGEARQTVFSEPRIRINTDPIDDVALGWSETEAWDDLARYYLAKHSGQPAGSTR